MRERIIFILGICSFLIQVGLGISGFQNTYLAIGLFSLAAILIMWALIPTLRSLWSEASSLSEPKKTLGLFIVIFLIVSSVLGLISAYVVLSWKPPKIEPQIQNIRFLPPKDLESRLRESLDAFGYKTGSSSNPAATFQFVVTDDNGVVNLNILQPKNSPLVIAIALKIDFTKDVQEKIAKLKQKDRNQLARQLRMIIDKQGILRSGISFPIKTITLTDPFLKDDLQNLSIFIQKVRIMFLMYYSIMDVISSFTEQ